MSRVDILVRDILFFFFFQVTRVIIYFLWFRIFFVTQVFAVCFAALLLNPHEHVCKYLLLNARTQHKHVNMGLQMLGRISVVFQWV